VALATLLTSRTGIADGVYFADHALVDEVLVAGRSRFNDADELVSENAVEWVIAAYKLEVGVADAGARYPNEGFARRHVRAVEAVVKCEFAILEPQADHAGTRMPK
jgi:hypothetical protein